MSKKSRRPGREEIKAIRKKLKKSRAIVSANKKEMDAPIEHRTEASNCKFPAKTDKEDHEFREDLVEAQIKAWRTMLPEILKEFAKLKDPRRPGSVEHKIAVVMMYGLLTFIFRLGSRRNMNMELTEPKFSEVLHEIFPELESSPHADTVARLLEKTEPKDIEKIQVNLIRNWIKNKKFKKLLIQGNLPISIDGTQKLRRNGYWNDNWLIRTFRNKNGDKIQQYVYVLEANITLPNGLNIPLMSEYLSISVDQEVDELVKQDAEIKGFYRLAERLKKYFPRLKIILFLDKLYACSPVIEQANEYGWEFIIALPEKKLNVINELLKKKENEKIAIPGQACYRERHQKFYWQNNILFNDNITKAIHAVACCENWEAIDPNTGEIKQMYSEHHWICSISISINTVHELCNLGARKRSAIEDNMNTEKNRGYNYKHAFSYDWKAMQCYHYLMRIAHCINALSEFTKKLKQYIKKYGWSFILKLIKETISNPWLTVQWIKKQLEKKPQLRLQLE